MTRNPRPPEAGVNRVYGNLAQALSRPMLNEGPSRSPLRRQERESPVTVRGDIHEPRSVGCCGLLSVLMLNASTLEWVTDSTIPMNCVGLDLGNQRLAGMRGVEARDRCSPRATWKRPSHWSTVRTAVRQLASAIAVSAPLQERRQHIGAESQQNRGVEYVATEVADADVGTDREDEVGGDTERCYRPEVFDPQAGGEAGGGGELENGQQWPDPVREPDVIEALGDETEGDRAEGRVCQLDRSENWCCPHRLGDHCAAVLQERRHVARRGPDGHTRATRTGKSASTAVGSNVARRRSESLSAVLAANSVARRPTTICPVRRRRRGKQPILPSIDAGTER